MPGSTPSPRRISLRDIARQAGVSVGSVSSVLTNRHLERRIPDATAEKIRKVAKKLGYLPNINARRLRGSARLKNSILLALVTSFEAPLPLVHHFIAALHKQTREGKGAIADNTFSLMIEMFSAGRLKEMPGLLTGDRFNAAILLNTVAEDDLFLTRVHLPYPAVLVNRSIPGYSEVLESDECGVRPAEIFAKMGRKRFAVLYGNPFTQITRTRVDSFLRRSEERLGRAPAEIIADSLSEQAAYKAVHAHLAGRERGRGDRFDALYTVSDTLAVGAYRAIKEQGLRIPKDIAVIGVGDYGMSPFLDPPLSSVGVAYEELAKQASILLLRQLIQGEGTSPRVILPLQ
ncbi:MAG TPA: substrate-binding domain-containing protein, partial [Candidatus Methylacidiphilales bacterium]